MKSNITTKLLLIVIIVIGALLRLYGLNWDKGHHMHPDERAIVIAIDKLDFPNNITEFFAKDSTWNPQFFAYGSFPMYLLRVAGSALSPIDPSLGTYTSINLLGRFLSSLVDLITIILIFKIGRFLFNKNIGLLAAFFYTASVLPIQLSHFFAVDTFLTMFVTLTLYRLLLFYKHTSNKNATLVGLSFGLALSSKVNALVLLAPIGITLILVALTKSSNNHIAIKKASHHLQKITKHVSYYGFIILFFSFITFTIFMPYALIDFQNFWNQTLTQSQLTKDPFAFPYTLQFVGKIPYWYELKNIFLWGLGPILGTLSFIGTAYFAYFIFRTNNYDKRSQKIILFSFFIIYTLIVGNFAVGFTRYMLPAYPLFALFAGFFTFNYIQNIKSKTFRPIAYCLLLIACVLWPTSFVQIYSRPNTRISASNWIYENVPPDKTLAIEHWDDQLPVGKPISYHTQTLKLYDPDTEHKWQEIERQLAATDYIILASNRLYVPLQNLTDCDNLPLYRCYPQTAKYYADLFSGKLGFRKVAEFTSYPTIPILNIPINDQSADENFTVFDHPKVIIFKKSSNL